MLFSANVAKGVHPDCRRSAPMLKLPLTEAELRSIFKRADINRDGRLSKQELKNAFASLGSHIPGLRAGQGLRRADADGDGYVSDDELDDLIKYALERGYTITKYTPNPSGY